MNAQKIVDEDWYGNQRFDFHITNHTVVFFTDSIKSIRCFEWCQRCEECLNMSIRIRGADIILNTLCTACQWVVHMVVHHLV